MSSLREARRSVREARIAVEHAQAMLNQDVRSLRERLIQHHLAIILGGGFLTGIAFTALPPKVWAKLGGALLGGSAWLARSPVGAGLVGTLFGLARSGSRSRRKATDVGAQTEDMHGK